MARLANRSDDLTASAERKRKSRGTDRITKAASKPLLNVEPDPDWHPIARDVWDAGLASGGAAFYESTDIAMLRLTCEGIHHWLNQGSRRSPELLRVLSQNLGSLLFTEADRRKVRIELEEAPADDETILASVSDLFATEAS